MNWMRRQSVPATRTKSGPGVLPRLVHHSMKHVSSATVPRARVAQRRPLPELNRSHVRHHRLEALGEVPPHFRGHSSPSWVSGRDSVATLLPLGSVDYASVVRGWPKVQWTQLPVIHVLQDHRGPSGTVARRRRLFSRCQQNANRQVVAPQQQIDLSHPICATRPGSAAIAARRGTRALASAR